MNSVLPSSAARRHTLTAVALVLLLALVSFLWIVVLAPHPMDFAGGNPVALTAYHAQDPSGVPALLQAASLTQRGEYLARAADCAACHTVEGGAPYAGGRAFVLPFGTLYSTNITPDKETGIGNYTDANFLDAVHKGIGPNNKKLYPAMPFASYTYMTDADALAIKAYLFTLNPTHAPAPQNTLAFPFDQRALMGVWAALFNSDKRFEPRTERDPQWNRGAYLVEAMGHCGECHTPRNLFFALNNRQKFAGAVQSGWRAYNMTANRTGGVGAWSDADLAQYLSTGHAEGRGTASGPMGEAVDESLSHLKPSDITAMVAYLRTVPSIASDLPEPRTTAATTEQIDANDSKAHGREVYEGACAGCHGWTGASPVLPFATLLRTRSVNDPSGNNVAQVIIHGGERHVLIDPNNMPAFGSTYSDTEIAAVANFVTARYGVKGSDLTAADVAKLRTED